MKIYVVFLLLLASFNISSQSFVATPLGLMDSTNLDKDYIVIKFGGKSASELYDLTNKFCQKYYSSPKNALQSDIKNEYIKMYTYGKDFILIQKGTFGEGYFGSVTFDANFNFKDNKVKFYISGVEMIDWSNTNKIYYNSPGGLTWCIFKSNGKPKGDLPIQYQNYFNKYISDYIQFVNTYEKHDQNW